MVLSGTRIILDEQQIAEGRQRGLERQRIAQRTRARNLRQDQRQGDLDISILGALCETAVASVLPGSRLTPNNKWSGDNGVDLVWSGQCIDVKGRRDLPTGFMVVYRRHVLVQWYCQVIQHGEAEYTIVGFIDAASFWDFCRPFELGAKTGSAVRIESLLPLERFIQEVRDD